MPARPHALIRRCRLGEVKVSATGRMRMCGCGRRTCIMRVLNAATNANHDPTTNPDPTLTLSLTLIINLTLTLPIA